MERFGWLTSRWEDVDPAVKARPRRRLYSLTPEGELAAQEIVSRARARQRQSGPSRLRPAPDTV
jgi:PadR family transcriptional regulator